MSNKSSNATTTNGTKGGGCIYLASWTGSVGVKYHIFLLKWYLLIHSLFAVFAVGGAACNNWIISLILSLE